MPHPGATPCSNCGTLSAVCLARYQLGRGPCCDKCEHNISEQNLCVQS